MIYMSEMRAEISGLLLLTDKSKLKLESQEIDISQYKAAAFNIWYLWRKEGFNNYVI